MANEQNLRPGEYKLSQEEAKKGGINSAKARKEKKAMRESLELLLNMPLDKGKLKDIGNIKNFAELEGKNITVSDAMMIAQIHRALMGDTKAATFIRDTAGQKPSKDEWSGLGEDDL